MENGRLDFAALEKGARIHFIGIGGISMSGLARILKNRGYDVSGSDRSDSDMLGTLRGCGIKVYAGHKKEQVHGARLVVYTAAAHADNPELSEARALGIPTVDRAECLGAIMRGYSHAVGVAGTHGKTTTTSMLAHALFAAELDPTISVGGMLDLIGGNIHIGSSDYFVTEACEYTNSFLKFYPTVAVITNIEEDHLDFFSGLDEIIESFRSFAMLTKDKGSVVALGSDINIKRALAGTGCDIHTYGMDASFEYYPENLEFKAGFAEFDICENGQWLCHTALKVPGAHNVLNALATAAVCRLLGVDIEKAARGIEAFGGTHRRFEKKGSVNGAAVIDDYAHHPTEIAATLAAAKKLPHKKIWCIFQPHTYSRTRTLWQEFVGAFGDCGEVILVDIYPAREEYDGMTRSADLASDIAKLGVKSRYANSFDAAKEIILAEAKEGDLIFTMGAGDVYKIGEELVK